MEGEKMTANMVDLFLLSILGGTVGAIAVLWIFYFHLKSAYRQYKSAVDNLKINLNFIRMQEEVDTMRVQVKALFGEFYQQEKDYRND